MTSETAALFTVFGLVFILGITVATHRIASTGNLAPIPLWSWTGGAALAAVVDVGLVYGSLLDLTAGEPSGTRIGWTVLAVVGALLFAALVFSLTGGTPAAPTPGWVRWRFAGLVFSGTLAVVGVVCMFLN